MLYTQVLLLKLDPKKKSIIVKDVFFFGDSPGDGNSRNIIKRKKTKLTTELVLVALTQNYPHAKSPLNHPEHQ